MNAIVIGGSSTQSRQRRPGKPNYVTCCSGAYEWLEDGRKILSWPMGQYGPLLGFPSLTNPLTVSLLDWLQDCMDDGKASLGSYAPENEQQLADKLALLYAPYLRSEDIGIRFFSNGTDACQAAVALARYATGREAFISVGYHGGSSPVFAFKPQNGGVLQANEEARFDAEFGNLSRLGLIFDMGDMACSIIETPSTENEYEAAEWLKKLADLCEINNTLFILDDIVTGFRYAPAGALEYYSHVLGNDTIIKADFICLGKALSTYGKVAALLGPADIMQALTDKVFASFTYNDHPLGFADALWTLEQYGKYAKELYAYNHVGDGGIRWTGQGLKDGLNILFAKYAFPAKCIGHPSRSAVVPTDDGKILNMLLTTFMNEHNILIHKPNFVTLAHTLEDVDKTLRAVEEILNEGLAM